MRDARTRTVAFAYLFLAVSYIEPVGYRHAYPTVADRLNFAHSFANNKAVVLFYGHAYDLLTIGGYSAWRAGGTLAIFAAVFGMLAAVRALRAEEEAGRAELVLAAVIGRGEALTASLAAIAGSAALLWAAAFLGSLAGGLPAPGSAYLALAVTSVIPVFVGVGALISQFAPTKRIAVELGSGCVAVFFLLRVIADTATGAGWLRWATPLGWAENLRAFTGSRPLVLLAPVVATLLLVFVATRIAARRDIGTGLLASHDRAEPRLALLSSPGAQALREERVSLLFWAGGLGALALVLGVVAKSVTSLGISHQLSDALKRLGDGSVLTPIGYLAFSFSFVALAVCLFAVSQVTGARHEEAGQRLETLFALPVSRRRWLGGRLLLAAASAAAIALFAALLAWLGATSQGVSLSLLRMLEAGANCLPAAMLFLGLAALAYSVLPRAGTGIAYGVLVLAYLWQLFGSLLGVPRWIVRATPFAHIGAVPAMGFQAGSAAVMIVVGVGAAFAAVIVFERRDLLGA